MVAHVTAANQEDSHNDFDTSFLQGSTDLVNLDMLLSDSHVLPGNYRVDIYVNAVRVGRRDVDFSADADSGEVKPCLKQELVEQLGIEPSKLGPEKLACYDLPKLIEQATVVYDSTRLRLDIGVPQAALSKGLRGYVDPSLWDQGTTVAFSNYQLSARRNETGDTRSTFNNINLRNGLNVGPWRLRNDSNLSAATGQPTTFVSNQTYVQRDVTSLKSQFSAGDVFTDSQLFDNVRYRGVKLGSDTGMFADSERGYVPIIRGVAETNATVEIRQNGFVLYSRTLAPGPFELTDVTPSGSNGDLEVTVIEADGRRRTSIQPFSSLPIMVREGHLDYSVSAGHYASNDTREPSPALITGTAVYGMTDTLTGAVGVQAAEGFQATAFGLGKNTRIGAVSLDLTRSRSTVEGKTNQGSSLRVLYAKTFNDSSTNFTIAGYRYSTEGYRSLGEHVQDLSEGTQRQSSTSRTRTEMSINQSLGKNRQYGSLYVNASDQRYWNGSGTRSLSGGYSNSWGDLNYNLSVARNQATSGREALNAETQMTLSLSFPLGSRPRSPRATVNTVRQTDGSFSNQAGVSGYLTDDGDSFYSLQAGNDSSGTSGSASVTNRTRAGDWAVGYGQGPDFRSQSLSASGSVVAHGGGVNFGPQVGETFTLVHVPGVEGAQIKSYAGAQTDTNGYAIVPNAMPYRTNWVSLDTRELGGDIDIENATQQVVPRRGAVVVATFAGNKGRRVQFELYDREGHAIPFGAAIEDDTGKKLGVSDPTGKALALLQEDTGVLTIKWGKQQCTAPFELPERDPLNNFLRARLECRPDQRGM